MIQDPWTECTKKTEFVFANEPTDNDVASALDDGELDAGPISGGSPGPDTTAAPVDESDDEAD